MRLFSFPSWHGNWMFNFANTPSFHDKTPPMSPPPYLSTFLLIPVLKFEVFKAYRNIHMAFFSWILKNNSKIKSYEPTKQKKKSALTLLSSSAKVSWFVLLAWLFVIYAYFQPGPSSPQPSCQCLLVPQLCLRLLSWCFPGSTVVKNLPANAGDAEDMGSIPGSGRLHGRGNGNPFWYSCLENWMDRGAWRATVHGLQRVGSERQHADTHTCPGTLLFLIPKIEMTSIISRFLSPKLCFDQSIPPF